MDRRNFITGTIKTLAAASLVVAASPEEILAFGAKEDVKVALRTLIDDNGTAGGIGPEFPRGPMVELGMLVFNAAGEPIGAVSDFSYSQRGVFAPSLKMEVIGSGMVRMRHV